MKRMRYLFLLLSFPLLISGCYELEKVFSDKSPHDKYRIKLEQAGLLQTGMGKAWLDASENAFLNFTEITLPFTEKGYFFPDSPDAYSYKFTGNRGEKIFMEIITDSADSHIIFSDLFSADGILERIAYADSNKIEYTLDETTEMILRLQPELLIAGSFGLLIEKRPSVSFPVEGKNSNAVKSFFGDSRDGGKRDHSGVDIFAPKGTPVLAAVDGVVTRTGLNKLGGKVVWLSNLGTSFYYAHLDSQIVSPASIVKAGDTLGLVGNTGNARHTPPHLHFGIYVTGEGAVDPFPFIRNTFPEPDEIKIKKELLGEWGRIRSNRADFYLSAGNVKAETLKKSTPFKIIGGSGKWIKIMLPDERKGFIASNVIEAIERPLNRKEFSTGMVLLNSPGTKHNFIEIFNDKKSLAVYGIFNQYYLVNYKERFLWVGKDTWCLDV